ncbi:protein-glutamine glutaminase family protein [Bdellovibrionota bacterium FG-2]
MCARQSQAVQLALTFCTLLVLTLSVPSALAEVLLVYKNKSELSVRIATEQEQKRHLSEANGFFFESEATKQSYEQITHALSPVVGEAEAKKAFAFLSSQTQIPFSIIDDGCYARAHEMALLLELRGILSKKVFVYGKLFATGKYGSAPWKYHVAPMVQVRRANGLVEQMIFDPSLFSQPSPLRDWFATIGQPHCPEAHGNTLGTVTK